VTALSTVDRRQLDWLLIDFARATPGVTHALVVSGDGLPLAASELVDAGLADHLAAVTSGLISLAHGVARSLAAEPMRQTVVEMGGGYLFVTPVSKASSLAVVADLQCDMGMVGYEMTLLAARVGHVLTPALRPGQDGRAQ
jgi:predicted regulator of Ras-like GTPase activity (Roadblock/LC7/MglB family)